MNKYLKSLGKNASKAFNHKINTNLKNKVLKLADVCIDVIAYKERFNAPLLRD